MFSSAITFRYTLLILFVLVYTNSLFGQPQTNNWFFAGNNGLSFASGDPVNIPGGQILAMEGASAISDKDGQLLFYTDGITVWNKSHAIMLNGQGLAGGHGSSTQSCIIVPKSKDEKQYYIFTTDDEGGPNGFEYSVVDMTLNNGFGGVAIKNQPLVTPCSEKVTAIRHCNKKDYWVITHRYGSDAYYAYLAGENGVNPTPVVSHTGSYIPVEYYTMAGGLKSSPDGKKIIALHYTIGSELSDFNNQTGVISNTTEIFSNNNSLPYGAEFSANSQKLYLAVSGYWYEPDLRRYCGLYQYDLSLPTVADIINSKIQIHRFDDPRAELGTLQRGPNGKIYLALYQKTYLSVINLPELSGAACDFTEEGVPLPTQSLFSLPNLVNSYGSSADSFRIPGNGLCVNTPILFNYTATGDVTALHWDFGEPLSGTQNFSSIANPSHTYSSGGLYTIRLIKVSPCGNDTLVKQIQLGDLQVSLGNDTTICAGSQYLIKPRTSGVSSYLWQDGSTLPTYTATSASLVWLQVSNNTNACIRRDSVAISTKPLPVVNLGKDTSLCQGTTLLLNAFSAGVTYLWNDNNTSAEYVVKAAGIYSAQVTLNGCTSKDSINIIGITKPKFALGADRDICPGLTLNLSPGALSNVTYHWQDGSTAPTYPATHPGLFYVDISNTCGTSSDSIHLALGNCTVFIPAAFTPNNDGLNDQFRILGTGLINEFELNIFDRYGHTVFDTRNKNDYWNGEFKGKKLPGGSYVYLIKYKEANSTEQNILKGTILLLR